MMCGICTEIQIIFQKKLNVTRRTQLLSLVYIQVHVSVVNDYHRAISKIFQSKAKCSTGMFIVWDRRSLE
jgi:hypothetical protein